MVNHTDDGQMVRFSGAIHTVKHSNVRCGSRMWSLCFPRLFPMRVVQVPESGVHLATTTCEDVHSAPSQSHTKISRCCPFQGTPVSALSPSPSQSVERPPGTPLCILSQRPPCSIPCHTRSQFFGSAPGSNASAALIARVHCTFFWAS